ncbi:MAG: hypothetical protein DWH82_04615 [Planctomycetota bacterium]|nr:MAG: hypothetical protein DWH82_04615 [Planctomycetota bacterium]
MGLFCQLNDCPGGKLGKNLGKSWVKWFARLDPTRDPGYVHSFPKSGKSLVNTDSNGIWRAMQSAEQ